MAKKATYLFLSTIFLSFTTSAAADESKVWYLMSESQVTAYFAKAGTFKLSNGMSSVLVQVNDKQRNKTEYSKVTIKDADCDNGYGVVSFYTMQGNLDFQSDYISEGESVGAGVGDFMCLIRKEMLKKSNNS